MNVDKMHIINSYMY